MNSVVPVAAPSQAPRFTRHPSRGKEDADPSALGGPGGPLLRHASRGNQRLYLARGIFKTCAQGLVSVAEAGTRRKCMNTTIRSTCGTGSDVDEEMPVLRQTFRSDEGGCRFVMASRTARQNVANEDALNRLDKAPQKLRAALMRHTTTDADRETIEAMMSPRIEKTPKVDGGDHVPADRDTTIGKLLPDYTEMKDLDTKGAAERLGAELMQVEAHLKQLTSMANMVDSGAPKGGTMANMEEDEGEALRHRLLRYRYERHVKSPVPPLDRNEASGVPRREHKTDKIDLNRDAARMQWNLTTKYRAAKHNTTSAERSEVCKKVLCKKEDDLTAKSVALSLTSPPFSPPRLATVRDGAAVVGVKPPRQSAAGEQSQCEGP